MNKKLQVELCGIPMKNPLTTASGTFNPQAHSQFYDLGILGAVTVKGVADQPWPGTRRLVLRKPMAACSIPWAYRIRVPTALLRKTFRLCVNTTQN